MAIAPPYRLLPFWVAIGIVSPQGYTESWYKWYEKGELSIYHKPAEKGLIHVKASALYVNTSVRSFINLLHDTENVPNWLSASQQVSLVASPTPSERIVHTYFSAPWPISDRDMLTHSCFTQVSTTHYQLQVKDTQLWQVHSKAIRVAPVKATWQLYQQGSDLRIEYMAYANPNGALPKWLVNKQTLKSIRYTLIAIRSQLKNKKYAVSKMTISGGACTDF
ncbi:START domain-containing protein [Pseudoalteromonas sp. MMG005]|uniref:START domain-containing protein n=1 Tax=Pseudoalteromonas sp. MMG005 TaxID=2822682 RepID=UPI001B3A7889|nr:START domain-containing protein [Pseudoalteromonas sp. MMG005]MBQ4847391.1 hypothetical protein [Pseudoalteromonas sp. MMG005]